MLLDRLLDSAGLELSPFALCDIRRGVRVELSPSADTHLYCILRGEGALRAAQGFAAAVAPSAIAIVPRGIAHVFEPKDGSTRVVSLRSVSASARLPTVIAGDGACGLLLIGARVRAADSTRNLLEPLRMPIVLDAAETSWAAQPFAALRAEQEQSWPGRRHMTELLMHQCLIHLLREHPSLWAPTDAAAERDARTTAVGLKLPRTAP